MFAFFSILHYAFLEHFPSTPWQCSEFPVLGKLLSQSAEIYFPYFGTLQYRPKRDATSSFVSVHPSEKARFLFAFQIGAFKMGEALLCRFPFLSCFAPLRTDEPRPIHTNFHEVTICGSGSSVLLGAISLADNHIWIDSDQKLRFNTVVGLGCGFWWTAIECFFWRAEPMFRQVWSSLSREYLIRYSGEFFGRDSGELLDEICASTRQFDTFWLLGMFKSDEKSIEQSYRLRSSLQGFFLSLDSLQSSVVH